VDRHTLDGVVHEQRDALYDPAQHQQDWHDNELCWRGACGEGSSSDESDKDMLLLGSTLAKWRTDDEGEIY
jgi:hypothetical protein